MNSEKMDNYGDIEPGQLSTRFKNAVLPETLLGGAVGFTMGLLLGGPPGGLALGGVLATGMFLGSMANEAADWLGDRIARTQQLEERQIQPSFIKFPPGYKFK